MKKKLINDILLLSIIIILIVLGFTFLTPKSGGKYVLIMIDGKESARYSLSENIETDIHTTGVNHLVIKNGTARITSADCKNNVCVNTDTISKVGETITCLPHKLIIKIISE